MTRRLLPTVALASLVVLTTRALVYALEPSPLAQELGSATPGPRPLLVGVVVLGLALAGSAAVLWLAALGVRERHALALRPGPRPLLRVRRAVAHAALTFVVSSLAFALVESYVHWRAGLGFHGLHCLVGPVHRDALPFLAALSALGAAAFAAAAHVVAWMRRTLELLRHAPVPQQPFLAAVAPVPALQLPRSRRERPGDPRGPPLA